jgi:hypothetical protein
VASSQLDTPPVLHADDVQAALLLGLAPFVDVLEDEVGFEGLLNLQHAGLMLAVDDLGGEGVLTELALELREVVGGHHAVYLLLDLAVDPGLETVDMHHLAGPLALTRRYQDVLLSHVVAETELTSTLCWFFDLVSTLELLEEDFLLTAPLLNATNLDDAELDPPQLYYPSGL